MFKKIDLNKFVSAMIADKVKGYAETTSSFSDIAKLICNRYGLFGRNILSIGGGNCYEEIAFIKEGKNNCYVVDIDEHGTLESIINECTSNEDSSTGLSFIIDDFITMNLAKLGLDRFDVIYASGFTPDEVRRGMIRDKTIKVFSLVKRCFPFIKREFCQWPVFYTKPIHHSLEVVVKRRLKDNGLFVLQSYGFGVDISVSPEIVGHMIKQLEDCGISLVEGYYFRESPGVSFWVAIKGNREVAEKFAKELSQRPKLDRFHARAEVDNSCMNFYSIV